MKLISQFVIQCNVKNNSTVLLLVVIILLTKRRFFIEERSWKKHDAYLFHTLL